MRKAMIAAALVVGSLAAGAQAAEPPPPATGPVVLDAQQLDRVAAGFGSVAGGAFWQAHGVLAELVGILPEPAPTAVGLLHGLIFSLPLGPAN
jgi:hypothetical protein